MGYTLAMPPITVLIVDDHPLYRHGVQAALADQPELKVLAAVGTAAEALAACRTACPAVILLDITLPDTHGVQAARELLALCPAVGVIALTAHDEEAYMVAMAEAGARGYLLKSATDAEIVSAVRTVAAGGAVFAPEVTLALVRRSRGEGGPVDFGLTQRERDVLQLAATGLTNREIARRLGISDRTAQAHLSHIFNKMNAASRTEAVTMALRNGLIELDESPPPT
jgi:DNA-binding NarL/FixJ family response regulator